MTSNELEIFKQSILDDVRVMMQTTGQVTQYIGARYVPLFADPLDWNGQKEYEPLTIVLNNGNSYTSRQFVPKGIEIGNTEFWANTGNYNAQIEQYRKEVATFDSRITENSATISKLGKRGSIMLAFGDSFGDVKGEWADILSKAIGLELDNYCLAGASWPFTNKMDECIAKYASMDKSEIAFGIAYGGINHTVSTKLTADPIINFITRFNDAFPGVPLYIAPLNNCNPLNTKFPNAYKNTTDSAPKIYNELRCSNGDFILLEDSWLYCTGSNDLWQADMLHPNEKGSQVIANNILSAMHGNTLYQAITPFAYNTEAIIETAPGYITRDGIYTPEFKIKNKVDGGIYLFRNGFPEPTEYNDMVYYDYDTSTKTAVRKQDGVITLKADKSNPQYVIYYPGLTIEAKHEIIIPKQFIPFR